MYRSSHLDRLHAFAEPIDPQTPPPDNHHDHLCIPLFSPRSSPFHFVVVKNDGANSAKGRYGSGRDAFERGKRQGVHGAICSISSDSGPMRDV